MKRPVQLSAKDIAKTYELHKEYERLGWVDEWDEGNKKINFTLLLKLVDFAKKPLKEASCLDVGSGQGDFSKWLRKRGVSEYVGVEIYEKAIMIAKQKYPDETFVMGDFLTVSLDQVFDYVFCSGALTVKLQMNNYLFLQKMVEKMWELSRYGVTFNMLTDDDTYPDPDLFFYHVERVRKICQEIVGENAQVYIEKTPHISQVHVYLYRTQV